MQRGCKALHGQPLSLCDAAVAKLLEAPEPPGRGTHQTRSEFLKCALTCRLGLPPGNSSIDAMDPANRAPHFELRSSRVMNSTSQQAVQPGDDFGTTKGLTHGHRHLLSLLGQRIPGTDEFT